jgi:DNA-directed RNA polymerase specialized sigma24 family protein
MRHDAINPVELNDEEQCRISVGILHKPSSPPNLVRDTALRTLSVSDLAELCRREIRAYHCGEPSHEAYGLELLHRAIVLANQQAWACVQQCLGEIVRGWLHCHPHREAACRLESEENYVALAFERFWQATVRQQVQFGTLAAAMAYLRASLNGAILDTLRAYSRASEVPLPEPGDPAELCVEEPEDPEELWELLQRMLPSLREQRLAYLLYHCGLKPREIVQLCSQEWSSVHEIYRLRRNIVERLLRNANQVRWRLS